MALTKKGEVRCGLAGGCDPAVPRCTPIEKCAEDDGGDVEDFLCPGCGFYICDAGHTGDTFMQPNHDVMTHVGDEENDEDW